YTVAQCVESVIPQIMQGLFYDDPPFMVEERAGTTATAARAVGAVLAYQLKDIEFRRELELGIRNAVLFGTNIWKWGWESFPISRPYYKRANPPVTVKNKPGLDDITLHDADDEIVEEWVDEWVDRPFFENIVNLRHVMVDPGLNVPDIRKARYVEHRLYLRYEDLEKWRERPGFTIPSREELVSYLQTPQEPTVQATGEVMARNPLWDARAEPRYEDTSIDPFEHPFEVLERWDNGSYMVVLQRKMVLCNTENHLGCIPFLSINWWEVPEAFYGLGLAKTIGSEQRLQQGTTNVWLDGLALNLNGIYKRKRGKSIPTQSIRVSPGKIVEVDDMDDFQPLERLPAVPEVGMAIQMSMARAEAASGANELITQGAIPAAGRTSMGRTATGANLLASGTASRMESWVDKLANQVIVPLLYKMHELNCALLPTKTLKYILDDEMKQQYDGDIIDILNARVKFDISAGARMQARRNMAQALPILTQFLMGPEIVQSLAIEGKKVEVKEVIRMFFQSSGWKNYNDVVVAMTKEDMQRWQQAQGMGKIQQQAQAKAALAQQQFQQKQQLLDQENYARAGRDMLRAAVEKSGEPEAITGEPGSVGFGSEA